jgi:tyrosyl-tRNA synthetase
MTDLILGTDGRKMSSSYGNTINLLDAPNDMFGKVMSIPDELIMEYFVHCTRVPMAEVGTMAEEIVTGANPRDAKVRLAKEIVTLYHGSDAAAQAEAYFVETFSKGVVPENVRLSQAALPELTLTEFMVAEGLATSKSDARRKIEQGGVSIDDEKITDANAVIEERFDGKVMKVGKKDFVKIIFKK